MMVVLAAILALWCGAAQAQLTSTGVGGVPYRGPGDIFNGATAAYGLVAYNAAWIANGPRKAINIYNQNSTATTDINVLAPSGTLDVAAANAAGGTDAVCTGTASNTTSLVLTSCTSTPQQNDGVSGGGAVAPAYLVSCGSFTLGSGTCTLNANQTISGTVTFAIGLTVVKMYDMSGNTNDTATQATTTQRPVLLTNCDSASRPCIIYNGTSDYLAPPNLAVSQTFSAMVVVNRPVTNSTTEQWFRSASGPVSMNSTGSANQAQISAGAGVSETLSDNALHVVQAVFAGASSVANIDGTDFTSLNFGTNAIGGAINIGRASTVSQWFPGYLNEIIIWSNASGATSAAQRTSMCNNMRLKVGSTGSC